MIGLILAAALASTQVFAAVQLDGDANVYVPVMRSLMELEAQRTAGVDPESAGAIQRASSVCYDDLGCFDKDGPFKHLKQLPEPPELVNTQFLLYTRRNVKTPQMLDYRKPDTILKSHIDPTHPLKIVTHGFGGRNNLTWIQQMKDAFLEMHDVNVIVVDWSLGSRTPYYIQAAVNSELVGAEIAVMFYFIKDNLGITERDLHVIGFSLGAHVVGFVGKRMKEMRGTRPARTTGLDPASPLFEEYGEEVHLHKDDADMVDVVHTNADKFIYGGVGMGLAVGHVDFYPNGGKRQPGCGSTIKGAIVDIFKGDRERACNHERAVHLFTESILDPHGCRYVGYKCANYTEFTGAKCMSCGSDCGRMGYQVEGTGIYYLMTKAKKPFCSDLAELTVHFSKEGKKSYGSIIMTVVGANDAKENVTLTEKDEKLLPGSHRSVAISLASAMKPLKSLDALYLRYNGWITKGAETYALGSVTIKDSKEIYVFKSCEKTVILKDNEYQTLKSC